jgi:hypothetical protein
LPTGEGAMCTDAALTRWNGGIELSRQSRISSQDACRQLCDTSSGCNGFVFWEERGMCRLYRECTHLLGQGSGEYRGSTACRRGPVDLCPTGFITAGENAMCTDAANTGWRDIELSRQSRISSIDACKQICDTNSECNGFVFWEERGACRLYRECTHLRAQGSNEYAGSRACRKV